MGYSVTEHSACGYAGRQAGAGPGTTRVATTNSRGPSGPHRRRPRLPPRQTCREMSALKCSNARPAPVSPHGLRLPHKVTKSIRRFTRALRETARPWPDSRQISAATTVPISHHADVDSMQGKESGSSGARKDGGRNDATRQGSPAHSARSAHSTLAGSTGQRAHNRMRLRHIRRIATPPPSPPSAPPRRGDPPRHIEGHSGHHPAKMMLHARRWIAGNCRSERLLTHHHSTCQVAVVTGTDHTPTPQGGRPG